MNTTIIAKSLAGRMLQGAIAITCLTAFPTALSAKPLGKVSIPLKGEEIANRKDISVSSGKKTIEPSKLYTYEFVGKVRGKSGTPAASLVRKGTSIAELLDSISNGSSAILTGTFSNPTGELPVTVLDRKISGKLKVPRLGKVKISLKLLGTINADGLCELKISRVKLKSSKTKDLGSIEYMKGSKLILSAAPVVTFLRNTTTVDENAGSVTVAVRRTTFNRGAVSVTYTTVPDSATEVDFTPTTGTITFADGETSQDITIPILDNDLNDGVRRFTIEISDPSEGAVLGDSVSTKIVILDDE